MSPSHHPASLKSPVPVHVFTLAAHTHLRDHVHDQAHLCAVLTGRFDEKLGTRRRSCTPGTVRISAAHQGHDIRVGNRPVRCVVVEFSADLLETGTRRALPRQHPSTFVDSLELATMARQLAQCAAHGGPDDLDSESRLVEMLAFAAREQRLTRRSQPPPWLLQVRERLEEEFANPQTLSALAATVAVHPSHLARAFREHFGCTIGAHLRARRLGHARRQLEHSRDPISRIAAEAGFADQAHLTRAFTSRWGVSPGRYRRRLARSS